MATLTRVLTTIFGIFFLILAVPMTLGGIAVLTVPPAIADNQGYMNTEPIHLQNDNSYAFISDSIMMNGASSQSYSKYNDNYSVQYEFNSYDKIVNFRIQADSYFIGLAPTSDIQHYLENVPYEVVSQMNSRSLTAYSVNSDKNGSLSSDPANQSFWIASGTNTLYYTPSNTDFNKNLSLVIMKADGSQGVDANVTLGVNVPILKPIGIALVTVGSIFLIITISCFVIAYKSKGTKRNTRYFAVQSQQPMTYYQTPDVIQVKTPDAVPSKYCVNCGTQTDVKANFCEVCGFEFNAT